MAEPRTYPTGVTSWVDIEHRDIEGAMAFYGGLFGWTFQEATPPGVPFRYLIARQGGHDAAGIGGPHRGGGRSRSRGTDRRRRRRAIGPLRRLMGCAVPALAGPAAVGRAGRERSGQLELQRPARRRSAPPGFADAIGWLSPVLPGESPHWHVSFAVADRDSIATAAERLGATVLGREDTEWTRTALIRDPAGAVFTASEFTPGAG